MIIRKRWVFLGVLCVCGVVAFFAFAFFFAMMTRHHPMLIREAKRTEMHLDAIADAISKDRLTNGEWPEPIEEGKVVFLTTTRQYELIPEEVRSTLHATGRDQDVAVIAWDEMVLLVHPGLDMQFDVPLEEMAKRPSPPNPSELNQYQPRIPRNRVGDFIVWIRAEEITRARAPIQP